MLPSILAFALIAAGIPKGFENVFAQEGFTTEDLVNETISFGNDTTTMMMNATIAFAQEDDTGMTSDSEEDMRAMNQKSRRK